VNINARINKIQKQLKVEVETLVLKNIEDFNASAYEFYTPILNDMQNIVNEVYSHAYIQEDMFEVYAQRLIRYSVPLRPENRDDILLQLTEIALKNNRQILVKILDKLFDQLCELPIQQHRFKLEYKKLQNTAVAIQTRFFNMNYAELNKELNAIVEYYHDSLIAYANTTRVIQKIEEIEVVDLEVANNNRLIKITELHDIIEFVESYGYKKVRQCGSHAIYKNNGGNITVIPVHDKTISKELAYGIQKQIYKTICC
jgi:predicted RNA binding protein YcfA (HicA-like mRNA interferase family)